MSYPGTSRYLNRRYCSWRFYSDPGNMMTIYLSPFATQSLKVYVNVFDGSTTTSTRLGSGLSGSGAKVCAESACV